MPRPIIGVVANYYERVQGQYAGHSRLNVEYSSAIMRAGGLPVILPVIDDSQAIEEFLDSVDGVMFGGGYDISPSRYGQKSHEKTQVLAARLEPFIFKMFELVDRRPALPVLGICLGCQVFNVARGGSLHQHIPDIARQDPLDHFAKVTQYAGGREHHAVHVQPGTRLAASVWPGSQQADHDQFTIDVNSGHHQAIDRLGIGLAISAFSPDGIVEAVEDQSRPFFLAVQWHPEDMVDQPEHLALFQSLVNAARPR